MRKMPFVRLRDSTMDLLTTCLTYLSYDAVCGGRDADEEQTIHENLLAGRYRFLTFASSAWIDLVKQSARFGRRGGTLGALNELLEDKLSVLKNPKFQQPSINDNDDASRRPLWPGAPELIAHSLRFYQDPDDIWTVDNGKIHPFPSVN